MEEYVRDVTGLNVELVQKTNLYLREALEKFSACVAAVPNTVEASVRMNTLATVGHATGSWESVQRLHRRVSSGEIQNTYFTGDIVFESHEHFLPVVGLRVPTEANHKYLLHAGPHGATFTMCLCWRPSDEVEVPVGDTTRVVPQMNFIDIVSDACDSSNVVTMVISSTTPSKVDRILLGLSVPST